MGQASMTALAFLVTRVRFHLLNVSGVALPAQIEPRTSEQKAVRRVAIPALNSLVKVFFGRGH
jgi:hypothetical protein